MYCRQILSYIVLLIKFNWLKFWGGSTLYSDLTSPFTCLAVPSGTGGRRTKVQDVDTHQSEDFWHDSEVSRGGLDTEDPLEPPRRTYHAACLH